MKKNSILFSTTLVILSLLIFGFTTWNNTEVIAKNSSHSQDLALEVKNKNEAKAIPDLYYGVDARFEAVKKEDVHNATSIYDFFNSGENQQLDHINSVVITIVKDNQLSHTSAYGTTDQFTEAQIKLLKSTDYFSHFTIRTEFKAKHERTGKLEERFFGPHITVVPEKQAKYIDGNEALIKYLKANSKDYMNVIQGNNLGAIKLSFIVSKEGVIKDVKHDAMTTGYSSIDERFIELLKNIPGKWTPAENAKGEKMDYEFVLLLDQQMGVRY